MCWTRPRGSDLRPHVPAGILRSFYPPSVAPPKKEIPDEVRTSRPVGAVSRRRQPSAGTGVALASAAQAAPADSATVHSKDGKRLFGSAEALRVARVSGPRLSPDGSRVAYTVASLDMEKDQPGKTVNHLWVVPAAGPATAARQFTRGDKSAGGTRWSPDGKIIAFVMNAGDEKDAKPQVWFVYADGGEPWQVTRHKGGVRGFEFSPNGKTLLFIAGAGAGRRRGEARQGARRRGGRGARSQAGPTVDVGCRDRRREAASPRATSR